MAMLKLSPAIPDSSDFAAEFADTYQYSEIKSKVVTLNNSGAFGEIVLRGEHFEGTSSLDAGTINTATFSVSGKLFGTITGLKFPGADIPSTLSGVTLIDLFLAGRDTIIGSTKDDVLSGYDGKDILKGKAGDDTLFGGSGNNRYTGGSGSDVFTLSLSDDKDVITDFDADGGGVAQDYLNIGDNEYFIVKDHHETIIDLGPRGQVTLIGVKPSQIDDSDFVI